MKILAITVEPMYPPRNAIAKRSLQLLSFLPDRHSLDYLSLEMLGAQNQPVVSSSAGWGSDFYGRCRRVVRFPAERRDMELRYGFLWYSRAYEQHITRLVLENHYDVVLGVSVNMAYYLRSVRSVPVVIDLNDADEMAYRREVVCGTNLRSRLRAVRNLALFQSFRRRILARYRDLVVVSEVDATFLSRQLKNARLHVIPLGAEPHFFITGTEAESPNVMMFHGSLEAPHNRDAAQFLLCEIYPRVARVLPETELWIVGPGVPKPLVKLAQAFPNVRLTGYVPDIKPILERATVYVCPHTTGSGMKTKVLEAWAMGKATVASTRSLGGLAAHNGLNTLIAETAPEFAAAVVRLFQNPGLRHTLGRNAHESAVNSHSPRRLSAMLEHLLMETAASAQSPPAQHKRLVLQEERDGEYSPACCSVKSRKPPKKSARCL